MLIRLDKYLANSGAGTRTQVKKIIKSRRVTVNGTTMTNPADKVNPNQDQVFLDGAPFDYSPMIYLMVNKPKGLVSATEDARMETVLDLLSESDRLYKPFPVGRLDKDTEGLLLLTNDGDLGHILTSPKHKVPKVYRALIDGAFTPEDAALFKAGLPLEEDWTTLPAEAQLENPKDPSLVLITLYEGKFHQVKRMCAYIGKPVLALKRLKMGPLVLDPSLAPGDYRPLTEAEVDALQNL